MKRILIVDDDAAIRWLYSEELSDEGYRVFTTNNYSELEHVISQHKPDLILFDIRTGKMGDFDVLYHVRESEPDIPIVLCSGCPEFPAHFKSWIADSYVGKSSDVSGLKEHITAVLRGKEARRKTLRSPDSKTNYFPDKQHGGEAFA